MNNFPKVSILIPTYNRAKIILETLNSAVSQTYKNIEIIVVDNKSTDNTFEIVKEFAKYHPNVRVYQNEENIGPVRNWRRCLDYATGEYVKILWSDDLIAPTFIEKTLPFLVDHEDVGFVFTGTEIFNDDTGQRTKTYFIGNTGIYDTKKFIEGSLLGGPFPVSPGNAVFRKKDLEKNLLIDIPNKLGIDFKMHGMGNDILIYLLTTKDYLKFSFVNETLSFFRAHTDCITKFENSFKGEIRYNTAMAFFVERYLNDIRLKNKFNSKLLVICLKNLYKKERGFLSIKDFYTKSSDFGIDIMFFIALVTKRLGRKFIHFIVSK